MGILIKDRDEAVQPALGPVVSSHLKGRGSDRAKPDPKKKEMISVPKEPRMSQVLLVLPSTCDAVTPVTFLKVAEQKSHNHLTKLGVV